MNDVFTLRDRGEFISSVCGDSLARSPWHLM